MLYCWGTGSSGQLGLGEEGAPEPVPFRRGPEVAGGQEVVMVACGTRHTLLLCADGSVASCGDNAQGQLGRRLPPGGQRSYVPELIQALEVQTIVHLSCGKEHSLAICNRGKVFSWGAGAFGQLGSGELKDRLIPKNVDGLSKHKIIQVACGHYHSIALAKEQIFKPYSIAALRNLDVIDVSCGDEHTAVLTQNGSVFTFGDNSAGQLGRGSSAQKTGPQKVDWIDGPVSHLACGSYHTVCISASGQLISFGHGPWQHGGSGASRSKLDETGCFNISALASNELLGIQVKQIFAGTSISFATTFQTQVSACANKSTFMEALPKINLMDRMLTEKWLLATAESETRQTAKREIEAVFSSPPCLTASFLKPRSALETGCCITVDLQKARELLEEISKRDWIAGRISFSLLNHLIPALPLNSPHQEALSIFLLLPECTAALETQKLRSVAISFATAVNNLSKRSSEILEKYWSLLPASDFNQIVQMLKKAVLSQLSCYDFYSECQEVIPLLKVLKKLYKVNKRANYKLQLSNFYIDELREIISPSVDLLRWRVWNDALKFAEDDCTFAYYCFHFTFNLLTKMEIFHCETYCLQEIAKENAGATLVRNRLLRIGELPKLPVFLLRVRRKNLVEDTMRKLSQVEDDYLKMQLLIEFEGEMSQFESGGILLEFFSYVFEEMVQPDYGMFMYCEHSSPMWFPAKPTVEKNKYFLFGILCGLAMYNRVTAYVPFPLAAFKKLIGRKPTLDDLKELSPVLGKSLQAVLDYKDSDIEENLQLFYSISWDNMDIDLIPNGSLVAVNNANKKDFINKYVDYIFNKSVEGIFQEFKRGFNKLLPEPVVEHFFEPQELMDVAIGNANYDWDLYEKNAIYWGMYSATHPTIRMFWNVFHELTLADKKGFLLFVVGSDRVPVMGMNSLQIKIHSHKSFSEEHIPEAQICFHLLLLPTYSKIEKLKEKLLQAIENNRGFGKQ
ncbi:probable E3 ubiquitin-protein ligase HERC6 [Rhineura floridana]|uniref:probable E3 ubiquitin-protein ligase HERC6 n=1 Tax=Rhineura floridana TaxID=261503 RepID=UPI002AC83E8B|nr:probable E3 ubiquitin-protein ligase HERC6 [Rhineura floridana]